MENLHFFNAVFTLRDLSEEIANHNDPIKSQWRKTNLTFGQAVLLGYLSQYG